MMPLDQNVLHFLSSPDLFYLFFVAGLLGIALEFLHPGMLIPGILGAFSLIIAFVMGSTLPISYGAAGILLASILFMIAEIFLPSFGILGLGGFVGFIFGSIYLIDGTHSGGLSISLYTILPTCFLLGLVMLVAGYLVMRTLRSRPMTGGEAMLGEIGIATEDFNGVEGTIRIDGELWTAEAPPGTSVKRGDKLGVTARDGLKLSVRALPL